MKTNLFKFDTVNNQEMMLQTAIILLAYTKDTEKFEDTVLLPLLGEKKMAKFNKEKLKTLVGLFINAQDNSIPVCSKLTEKDVKIVKVGEDTLYIPFTLLARAAVGQLEKGDFSDFVSIVKTHKEKNTENTETARLRAALAAVQAQLAAKDAKIENLTGRLNEIKPHYAEMERELNALQVQAASTSSSSTQTPADDSAKEEIESLKFRLGDMKLHYREMEVENKKLKAQLAQVPTAAPVQTDDGAIAEKDAQIDSLTARVNDLKTHYREMEVELKKAGEASAAQASTIADLRGVLAGILALVSNHQISE